MSLAMFGTSAWRSWNRSCGVAQSSPITATLGPCCMRRSFRSREPSRCGNGGRAAAPGGASAVGVSYQSPGGLPNPRTSSNLRRWAAMTLLRRTLKAQAAVWLLWSLALGLAPRLVLEDLFSQPILAEYAWV